MRRFSPGALRGQPTKLPSHGALRAPMRVARTGPYRYRMPDGSERVEYRGPEELKRIAAQLKDVPITAYHPGKPVTAENWRESVIGHVSDVEPELETHDGEQWIVAQGVFRDAQAIAMLESGAWRELSLGCDMTQDPGPPPPNMPGVHAEQLGLVPNHLGVLPPDTARAGREARVLLDSGDESYPMSLKTETDPSALIAALTELGTVKAALATITAERDTLAAAATADKTRLDSLQAELATVKGELTTSKERLDSLDPETLVEAALAFRERMTPALPEGYVFRGKTSKQVRLDAANHLGGQYDDKASDQILDGFIVGALKGRTAPAGSKPVPVVKNDGKKTPDQIREEKIAAARAARK